MVGANFLPAGGAKQAEINIICHCPRRLRLLRPYLAITLNYGQDFFIRSPDNR